MKITQDIPIWKKAPLIKYLLPFTAGILVADNLSIDVWITIILLLACLIFALFSNYVPAELYFRIRKVTGISAQIIMFGTGICLHSSNDIRKDKQWYGNYISD